MQVPGSQPGMALHLALLAFPSQLLHWPTGDSDNSLLIGTERWVSGDPSARPAKQRSTVRAACVRSTTFGKSTIPMLDFNARGHTQARDRPIIDPALR